MNRDLVFAKTFEGEEAVEQRTRLVQRNLRTVLILVDGKSNVGQLVSKAGSEEVLVATLEQLERDGFIRLVSGDRLAMQASGDDSLGNFLEPASEVSFPSVTQVVEATQSPIAHRSEVQGNPFSSPASSPVRTAQSLSDDATLLSPFTVPGSAAGNSSITDPFQTTGNPFVGATGNPFFPPVQEEPLKESVSTPITQPGPASSKDKASIVAVAEPIYRRRTLITGKRIGIAMAILLMALIVVVFIYPYERYRPRIEATLSETLGQPVRVAEVNASFLPIPALVLSQVTIGNEGGGEPLSISEIRAVPSISTLFGGKKEFRRVVLKGALVPIAQLGVIAFGVSSAGIRHGFAVGRVDIDGMTIGLRDISFRDYSGRADFSSDGNVRQMELQNREGTISIQVGPGASANDPANVVIQGQGWRSGESSPFIFDSLTVNGRLAGNRFIAEKLEGRIFGGVVQGQMQLDWGRGMMVSGDVNVDYMSAPQLATALGSGSISMEGQASARLRFGASGDSWSSIAGKIPLEGSFLAKTGVVSGLDLVEAIRRGSKLATRGGATRFDQFTGRYRWDGGSLQLSDLELSSGAVRASGNLTVAKGGVLAGSVVVVIQSSAATLRHPVNIAGTVKDPQLFAGRY